MWVTWLFVFFAIAMIVGPVMMLRPSPSITKLANMRARASQQGVSVRIPSREKHGPVVSGAIYSLPLSPELRKQSNTHDDWCLRRQKHAHDIHFHKFWDWEGKGRVPEAFAAAVILQLDTIPDSISLLECNVSGVGALWDERCRGAEPDTAVDVIVGLLRSVMTALESP